MPSTRIVSFAEPRNVLTSAAVGAGEAGRQLRDAAIARRTSDGFKTVARGFKTVARGFKTVARGFSPAFAGLKACATEAVGVRIRGP
jgi:hypothetical protein